LRKVADCLFLMASFRAPTVIDLGMLISKISLASWARTQQLSVSASMLWHGQMNSRADFMSSRPQGSAHVTTTWWCQVVRQRAPATTFAMYDNQLALVPAFGRQRRAMLILVCWAMLILFLPGIVIRIKPQYLSDILKHFQFQSQKKSMNQIKFLSTSVNTTFVVKVLFYSYWSCSAWWPVLCACWGEVEGWCNWMKEIYPWE